MKLLKMLMVCCLAISVLLLPCNVESDFINPINQELVDSQTKKKITILKQLEKADLITTEIKNLETVDKENIQCLALNIYHEARGSTLDDRVGTSFVVFNRLNDKSYPLTNKKSIKTMCNVIFDKYQFCWTNNEQIPFPKELDAWNDSQMLAYKLYTDSKFQEFAKKFELKHYVTTSLLTDSKRPKWIDKRTVTVKIGAHSYMSLVKTNASVKDLEMIIKQSLEYLNSKR